MSDYKFMQSDATRDLIVIMVGDSLNGYFKGVCVTDCRSVYPDYKIGEVRSDWIASAFTEITPQEAKDKHGLVLYQHEDNEGLICCQILPLTDRNEMPVVYIGVDGTSWKMGECWNLLGYRNFIPLNHEQFTQESVDWSEAPVWAEAYGKTLNRTPVWMGVDKYKYVTGDEYIYDYKHGWLKDELIVLEKRPPRTIAQILGVSSLSVNSEIAKNQKTVITTPKLTKTQRVINRAFEDIFATTVTFKNPEWGALLFETIEPRLTYEQKLDLVCAVYGVYDEGESDEEHF